MEAHLPLRLLCNVYVLTEIRYAGGEIRSKRHPGLKAEKYAEGTDGTDARDLTDRAPAWNFRD